MNRVLRGVLFASSLLCVPVAAVAQVGHLPEESPYRDLPYKQELGLFSGYYNASEGAAGVAPQSGPMIGARYELRIGGPVQFMARVVNVFSQRTALDPTKPVAERASSASVNLVLADVGITGNLTGQKSWHGLVPIVQAGLGLASDFQKEDVGGYDFGTPFALTFGTGFRYSRGDRLELRADVTDYLYQLEYPQRYFVANGTQPPILNPAITTEKEWKHNFNFALGLTYHFARQ
ncbi:MAG TPA: hypothetical protein VHQ45_02385 [Gemmatimonadaceae bacterium]|nr:hypothetical protein [Gemmatimonadaceae bacterium]